MSDYVHDRAYERQRNVAVPDTIPEHHENVARGADIMARQLRSAADNAAAQGNLLAHQSAVRMAERHEQLADYHRGEAQRRREAIAGHPSSWVYEED